MAPFLTKVVVVQYGALWVPYRTQWATMGVVQGHQWDICDICLAIWDICNIRLGMWDSTTIVDYYGKAAPAQFELP